MHTKILRDVEKALKGSFDLEPRRSPGGDFAPRFIGRSNGKVYRFMCLPSIRDVEAIRRGFDDWHEAGTPVVVTYRTDDSQLLALAMQGDYGVMVMEDGDDVLAQD